MSRVLIIKNPRRIKLAMDSYEDLDVDLCLVRGTTQLGSSHVINGIVSMLAPDTMVGVISDDTVLTNQIVRSVFQAAEYDISTPASGWVRIYDGHGDASVTQVPFRDDMTPALSISEYDFVGYSDMRQRTGIVKAFFSGMALHTMTAEMWRRFPARVHRPDVGGGQSDLHMAQRLHAAGLHINVVADAEIRHLKVSPRSIAGRRISHPMYVGTEHEEVIWR